MRALDRSTRQAPHRSPNPWRNHPQISLLPRQRRLRRARRSVINRSFPRALRNLRRNSNYRNSHRRSDNSSRIHRGYIAVCRSFTVVEIAN